jgi:hypothetical protein
MASTSQPWTHDPEEEKQWEKGTIPLQRQQEFLDELRNFRVLEDENKIPWGHRLFVIIRPYINPKTNRYPPTNWRDSGALRRITHMSEVTLSTGAIQKCSICDWFIGFDTGTQLPCGCHSHWKCISKLWDQKPWQPACPDCKSSWPIYHYPKWVDAKEGEAVDNMDRYRPWKEWLTCIKYFPISFPRKKSLRLKDDEMENEGNDEGEEDENATFIDDAQMARAAARNHPNPN